MRGVLCVVLLVSSCLAADLDLKENWGKFKSAFKKKFENSHHENEKQGNFEKAVKNILKHNLEADLGEHTYKKGINEFSDMPHHEFASKFLGLKIPQNFTRNYPPPSVQKISARGNLPANFDWRNQGAVTSVKNQGGCGSCWSFSTAASMEGALKIKTGRLVDLSEQQLLDCSGSYGTGGCNGAWPKDAFAYIKDNGIVSYQCCPYKNTQSRCSYNSNCVQTKISSHYDVPRDENQMMSYLYNYGPMSVCVFVNDDMQSYSGGIFYNNNCNNYVNHAVTLVGYGTENGRPYWTIKNSWGSGWGEGGYIRIARGVNMCNVNNVANFAII